MLAVVLVDPALDFTKIFYRYINIAQLSSIFSIYTSFSSEVLYYNKASSGSKVVLGTEVNCIIHRCFIRV